MMKYSEKLRISSVRTSWGSLAWISTAPDGYIDHCGYKTPEGAYLGHLDRLFFDEIERKNKASLMPAQMIYYDSIDMSPHWT